MNVYKLLIKRKTKEGNNRKINSSLICTTPDFRRKPFLLFLFCRSQTSKMEKNCPSLFLLHYSSELRFHSSGMKRFSSSCFASSLPYFLIAARSLEGKVVCKYLHLKAEIRSGGGKHRGKKIGWKGDEWKELSKYFNSSKSISAMKLQQITCRALTKQEKHCVSSENHVLVANARFCIWNWKGIVLLRK